MPKYKLNDDGVLTIIDDRPSANPANFRSITKRALVVAIVLAVVLAAYSLFADGPFAKGMPQDAWEHAMEQEGPHTAAGVFFGNVGKLSPAGRVGAVLDGTSVVFSNFASNLGDFGALVVMRLDGLSGMSDA